MHHLARNFAFQIEQQVHKEDLSDVFGSTLQYKSIYLGNMSSGDSVSVEEFVKGNFTKYINDGLPCGDQGNELF